jgi:hypothetical protein
VGSHSCIFGVHKCHIRSVFDNLEFMIVISDVLYAYLSSQVSLKMCFWHIGTHKRNSRRVYDALEFRSVILDVSRHINTSM